MKVLRLWRVFASGAEPSSIADVLDWSRTGAVIVPLNERALGFVKTFEVTQTWITSGWCQLQLCEADGFCSSACDGVHML